MTNHNEKHNKGSSAQPALRVDRVSGRKMTQSPTKTATALHYQPGEKDIAPVVIAQEQGDMARMLVGLAKAKGVKIEKDADLASLLAAAAVGEEIPIEAFLVVAEIFRYLYQEQGRNPPKVEGQASRYWKSDETN